MFEANTVHILCLSKLVLNCTRLRKVQRKYNRSFLTTNTCGVELEFLKSSIPEVYHGNPRQRTEASKILLTESENGERGIIHPNPIKLSSGLQINQSQVQLVIRKLSQ